VSPGKLIIGILIIATSTKKLTKTIFVISIFWLITFNNLFLNEYNVATR